MDIAVEAFVKDICDLLNIQIPTISYDTSHFQTETMMAQCDLSGETIYLRECDRLQPDYFLAIAHELRHLWQIQNDKEFYFANYKPIELCHDIESYNLQMTEIDANAFASLIMIEWFKLRPLFQGLSDDVKDKINERIEEIAYDFQ